MNKKNRGANFILWIVFLCLAVGYGMKYYSAYQTYKHESSVTYVSFSDTEEMEWVDYEQVLDYRSPWSQLRSSVYYNALNEREKKVYELLEYALDHAKPYVFIDDSLLVGTRRPVSEILTLLALDSPFLEQNLSWRVTDQTHTFPNEFDSLSFEREGVCLSVKNFSADRLEKKKEALAAANTYVAAMPEFSSQREAALYIYRDFLESKEYREYPEGAVCHYLYDGITGGATQCDGFANAYSLLCRLKGIEILEKKNEPAEGEEGHTWNAIFLDGAWYNVDCALSEEARNMELENDLMMHFAFSDLVSDQSAVAFSEVLPSFTENSIPVVETFPTFDVHAQPHRISQHLTNTDEKWILICVQSGEKPENWFQAVADSLRGSIRVLESKGNAGHFYYFRKT